MLKLAVVSLALTCALLSCTDPETNLDPLTQPGPRQMLECTPKALLTMDGQPFEAKVPTLWVDLERASILRAFEMENGRVVRNPYLLRDTEVSAELLGEMATKGLPTSWGVTKKFHYRNADRLLFFEVLGLHGLIVTLERGQLAPVGGELAELSCKYVEADSIQAHQELVPADIPPPPEGCADNTIEQSFSPNLVGCSGSVPFPQRATLCAPGWKVCTAKQWVEGFGNVAAKWSYWTDDQLKYSGSQGSCSVSTTFGSSCDVTAPMRICAGPKDPLGSQCNWYNCGYETTSKNHYFGGCNQNSTAGAVCCR
jgi:hypothetical protein